MCLQDFVLSVAVSPDGKWVVSGSKDRGVQFWDPVTANVQFMLQGHKNSGEFPLLIYFFWCTIDRLQWIINHLDFPPYMWMYVMIVISVAMSPAGTYFATGSGDTRARVWSYESTHQD